MLTTLLLAVWILFFDKNDIFSQMALSEQLKALENEKQYYAGEIARNKAEVQLLRTNPAYLEKTAREKYLMKKDNEDVFVIVRERAAAEPK